MDQILSNTVIVSVLVVVIGAIVAMGVKYAGSFLGTVADRTKGTLFEKSVAHLSEVIDNVLVNAGHTIVADLKAAAEDGVLTNEELNLIVAHAKEEVLSVVGPQMSTLLQEFVGDGEKWLEIKIQALVITMFGKQQ